MNRKAFTLVELLVVVAIIVILIAIMVPAMERALAEAQKVRCLANLKGIGTAMATYLNDNQRRYPVSGWFWLFGKKGKPDWGYNQPTNIRALNAYLGFTGVDDSVQIAGCPSDIGDSLYPETGSSCFDFFGTSYQVPYSNHSGVEGCFGGNGIYSSTQVIPTQSKIVASDATFYGNRPLRLARTRWHQFDYKAGLSPGEYTRKSNALFADSHAEYFLMDNNEIDDEAQPGIGNRTPNPSIGWW